MGWKVSSRYSEGDMSSIIQTGKSSELPPNAVLLSKEEAAARQWKFIYEWKPRGDVWPYIYGVPGLAVVCGLTSLYITGHYRQKLKLRSFGKLPTYIPLVAVPTFLLPILHYKFVSEEILLQSACPVCIEVRSMLMQATVGVAYPLFASPLISLLMSNMYATYRVPEVSYKNKSEVFNFIRQLSRPLLPRLGFITAAHVALAATLTQFEATSYFNLRRKLMEHEQNEAVTEQVSVRKK